MSPESLSLEQRATIANAARRVAEKTIARIPPGTVSGIAVMDGCADMAVARGWLAFADEIMKTPVNPFAPSPRETETP